MDVTHGRAVGGHGTILHTTDGGAAWTDASIATAVTLRALAMFGSGSAFAAGDDARVYRTVDGSTSWGDVTPPSAFALTGVAFADAANGLAVGGTGALACRRPAPESA